MTDRERLMGIQNDTKDYIQEYDRECNVSLVKTTIFGLIALIAGKKALDNYGIFSFFGGAKKQLENLDEGIEEHWNK